MPPSTAAPGPNRSPARNPGAGTGPGSASPSKRGTGRREDSGPGGCAPPAPDPTSSSSSAPSAPRTATTGSRPRATTPESSCGTWPRSGTPPASARSAADPPASVTSNVMSRTRRTAGRACVMAAQSVVMITGSSSSPGGTSSNSPTEPSAGPPHPDATTSPNPPGTRSKSGRPGSKSLFGSQRVSCSLGVSLAPDQPGGFSSVPEALEPPAVHALGEWFRDLGRDDESGEENQHAEVKPERRHRERIPHPPHAGQFRAEVVAHEPPHPGLAVGSSYSA